MSTVGLEIKRYHYLTIAVFLLGNNMIQRNDNLPINTVTLGQARTIEQAEDYEKKFTHGPKNKRLNRLEKDFARRVFELVGSDSHIVDVPCGSGRFFEIFSKARQLTMVDYSVNMLKVCKERFGALGNVRLIEADISSLPLPDNSADLCFCMRLFHHMESNPVRLDALKELARVSKKYVALSFYNKNCWRFYRKKILGKQQRNNHIAFGRLLELAKQTGLELVERFPRINLSRPYCRVIFKKT